MATLNAWRISWLGCVSKLPALAGVGEPCPALNSYMDSLGDPFILLLSLGKLKKNFKVIYSKVQSES